MSTVAAFIAATRFGLGAAPGELKAAASDPRGWLGAQITGPAALPAEVAKVPPSLARVRMFTDARRAGPDAVKKLLRKTFRQFYVAEAGRRTLAAIRTEAPFRERLVAFWSNHFTVSISRPQVAGLAVAFENEAIRPHVTGRFADMLPAVIKHPAMLFYLDNVASLGPHSRAGKFTGRGLNENLAREALELHTLGVEGGYSQADVRQFARILTGWSVRGRQPGGGAFRFYPYRHEPGAKTLLGRRYAENVFDAGEGERALDDLARHPATARFLAFKLARHFIADDPPAAAVARLAAVYRHSDGHLGAMAAALIDSPEPWKEPLGKVKSPRDLVVSMLRATGYEGPMRRLIGMQRLLAQMPFAAPSPAGWPDVAAEWIGPESMMRRIELCAALGRRARDGAPPAALAAATIGPVASDATMQMLRRAPSIAEALTLLFASPEFQRR